MKKVLASFLLIGFFSVILFFVITNLNKYAGLEVKTNGVECSLFLNDKFLDVSDFVDRHIKPGHYKLLIKPNDEKLAPFELDIDLYPETLTFVQWNPGETPSTSSGIVISLEKKKNLFSKTGDIYFKTIPDNALIALDNRNEQYAPINIKNLEPGPHHFKIYLPAYEPIEKTIQLVKGFDLKIFVKLARETSSLKEFKENELKKQASESAKIDQQEKQASDSATLNNNDKKTITILKTNFYKNGVEGVNVREKPSLKSKIIDFAQTSKSYELIEETDDFYKIKINDKIGFISKKYAKLN